MNPTIWGDFLKTLGCAVVPEVSPPIDDIEIIEMTDNRTAVTPTSPLPQPQIVLSAKEVGAGFKMVIDQRNRALNTTYAEIMVRKV